MKRVYILSVKQDCGGVIRTDRTVYTTVKQAVLDVERLFDAGVPDDCVEMEMSYLYGDLKGK